ncbi:TIR domain-containing protein, partial [Proteus faecis]|uniref:TIR domain-containing protein n=1 Tax=Proteus faecis TaxID=2050967 RepID=UPI003075E297
AESDGTRPPRVFVSFDFDNDQQLKHLLIGQTRRKDLPFSVVDGSLKEAAPEPRWKEAALREIRRCDVVVVLLGRYTHKAPGVLAEVAMARAEG